MNGAARAGHGAEVVDDYAERHLRNNIKRRDDVEKILKRDIVRSWAPPDGNDQPPRRARPGRRGGGPRLAGGGQSPVALVKTLSPGRSTAARSRPTLRGHQAAPQARSRGTGPSPTPNSGACGGAFDRVGYPFGAIGKLLLLTAQRRGEVAAMRWEVDLEAADLAPAEATGTKAAASTSCRSPRRRRHPARAAPLQRSTMVSGRERRQRQAGQRLLEGVARGEAAGGVEVGLATT